MFVGEAALWILRYIRCCGEVDHCSVEAERLFFVSLSDSCGPSLDYKRSLSRRNKMPCSLSEHECCYETLKQEAEHGLMLQEQLRNHSGASLNMTAPRLKSGLSSLILRPWILSNIAIRSKVSF
jgi:hypothetical protein